jgi:HAD superfamily hydrolase (TIGR01509 family)
MTPLKALVFDMDGTIVDSDPTHLRAFADAFAPYGVHVDEEVFRTQISGRTNPHIFGALLPNVAAEEYARLADEKEAHYRRLAHDLTPLHGLPELVAWAGVHDLRLALVTNGPRLNVEHTLAALGMDGQFEVTIAGEDVARAKPDPLPYLTALDRLGIQAAEAIAFEDSPAGLKAAKAAGLFTVGVLTGQPAEILVSVGADMTVRDFRDPALLRFLERRRA